MQILEFIFALKYYSSRWIRAKLYASMLGFLKENTYEINNFYSKRNSKIFLNLDPGSLNDIQN